MVVSQIIINTLISASIYALIAYGFSLVYSTNKIVHFAHGGLLVVAGYSFYGMSQYMSIIPAIGISLLFSLFIGYLFHVFYSSLQKRKSSSAVILIASFGLLLLIESVIQIIFGADVKTVSYFPVKIGLQVFDAYITPVQIAIILFAFVLFVLLFLFSKYTKLGKAFRAVSSNKEVAEIIGISAKKIQLYSFLFSGVLGCIAGVLIALEQNLVPSMGGHLIIKGFTATIIGGIGSVAGAGLGALILGFAENIGVWFLPSGYKDAIAFTLLILFLLFRPKGVLGR